jgi:4-amino-4-deoxy-L-arabinose transferase-like glycosyltransferase
MTPEHERAALSTRDGTGIAGLSLRAPVVGAAFALLVFVLRSSTFFQSVENWDESLYLLMARSLLDGHAPYTEVWNHKPPGIVLLFALGQLAFGRTVASIRILACLAVSASCLLLFLIGRSLRNPTTGIVAGLLYATFSLDYGRSSCLELFYTPLVLCAFFLVLTRDVEELFERPALPLALGVAGGLALQLKFVVVFDLAALALFVLASAWRHGTPAWPARILRFFALAALPSLVFFAVAVVSFAAAGHLGDYLDANFTANARYVSQGSYDYAKLGWMIQRRIRESFPLWLTLFLGPFYLLFFRALDSRTRRGLAAGLLWAAFALLGIYAPRRLFAHYFLELLPSQCLVTALVVCWTIDAAGAAPAAPAGLLLVLVLLGPVLRAVDKPLRRTAEIVKHRYVEGVDQWGDEPAAVAAYLRPKLGENDYLYVADYHPILYYLLPVRAPTRFLFPPFLVDEHWSTVTGVDREQEVRAIFLKRPRYVVKSGEHATPFYRLVREELDRSYRLEHTIGSVEIYRRRD